jgi:hypothetical protein
VRFPSGFLLRRSGACSPWLAGVHLGSHRGIERLSSGDGAINPLGYIIPDPWLRWLVLVPPRVGGSTSTEHVTMAQSGVSLTSSGWLPGTVDITNETQKSLQATSRKVSAVSTWSNILLSSIQSPPRAVVYKLAHLSKLAQPGSHHIESDLPAAYAIYHVREAPPSIHEA